MEEIGEVAKAVQASARLGEKGLESAEKAGSFISRVFKGPTQEIVGIVEDKLRFIRWKRLIEISESVDDILKSKGVSETRAVAPKLALPIIEEATLEEDPKLQDLWKSLLVNAMDPAFNDEIRYGYIEMIKSITATEVSMLNFFYTILMREKKTRPVSSIHKHTLKKEAFQMGLNIDLEAYAVSMNNLMRLQLMGPAVLIGGLSIDGQPMTAYKGIDIVVMTPLGIKFVEACISPTKPA